MRDPSGNQITFTFVQIHSNYFPIYMYSTHPFIYLCYDAQRVSLTQGVPLPCLMHFCANGRLFGRGHVVFMPLLLPISNKEEERGSEETESRRSRWPPGTWEAGGEPEETRGQKLKTAIFSLLCQNKTLLWSPKTIVSLRTLHDVTKGPVGPFSYLWRIDGK